MDNEALISSARSPNERLLRAAWIERLVRSTSGAPVLPADFVVGLGRSVVLIDARDKDELTGPLGHIHGSVWIDARNVASVAQVLPPETPVVIMSRTGERGAEVAKALEAAGMHLVAALGGGMVAWKYMGFATTRDAKVFERQLVAPAPPAAPFDGQVVLSAKNIEEHIGDPRSVRWVRLASFMTQGRVSCVDGRDDHGVIGTPGGDAGEFLLALAAIERLTGRLLGCEQIEALLLEHIDTFGRFYMHSDMAAMNKLIKAMRADPRLTDALKPIDKPLEWRAFMASPPQVLRAAILEHLVLADNVGCGHLRLSIQNAPSYGVRPALVTDFLRTFHEQRWNGAPELDFVILGGGHQEGAVVNVWLEDDVHPFTKVPLVSPAFGNVQMFVNHPQVAAYLRTQFALFFAQRGESVGLRPSAHGKLAHELHGLAREQLAATLGALAKDLPLYDVTFANEETFTVRRR